MTIVEILEKDEDIAQLLMARGMHCIGCMAASGESLEQAMYVHGYMPEDVDVIIDQINEFEELKTRYQAQIDEAKASADAAAEA